MPDFISTRVDLDPYVNGQVCLFRNGEYSNYCVMKSTYGSDLRQLDNSFTISNNCGAYAAVCGDQNTTNFNNWISQFF